MEATVASPFPSSKNDDTMPKLSLEAEQCASLDEPTKAFLHLSFQNSLLNSKLKQENKALDANASEDDVVAALEQQLASLSITSTSNITQLQNNRLTMKQMTLDHPGVRAKVWAYLRARVYSFGSEAAATSSGKTSAELIDRLRELHAQTATSPSKERFEIKLAKFLGDLEGKAHLGNHDKYVKKKKHGKQDQGRLSVAGHGTGAVVQKCRSERGGSRRR